MNQHNYHTIFTRKEGVAYKKKLPNIPEHSTVSWRLRVVQNFVRRAQVKTIFVLVQLWKSALNSDENMYSNVKMTSHIYFARILQQRFARFPVVVDLCSNLFTGDLLRFNALHDANRFNDQTYPGRRPHHRSHLMRIRKRSEAEIAWRRKAVITSKYLKTCSLRSDKRLEGEKNVRACTQF